MSSNQEIISMLLRRRDILKWSPLYFLTSLLYLRVAALQIDPHHDGIILAPAVAVSEGLKVQAQAFSQYGPLSPLLQGTWLFLTNPTLLNLRIFTAIQVGLIAVVLFKVLREYLSNSMANLITLMWLICSGIWATKFPGALLPWPSLVSTAFALSAYYFYQRARKSEGLKCDLFIYTSSALIGLSGFARIQSWLLIVPFVLSTLLSQEKRLLNSFKVVFGFVIGLSGMVVYLYNIGALDDYFKQSILFPLTVYPQLGSGNRYNRFETGLYVIELFVLATVLWAIWKSLLKFNYRITYLICCTIVISALTWGFWIQRQENLWIRLRILFGEPFERVLVSPFYSAAIGSILALLYIAFNTKLRPSKLREVQFVPTLFAAIAALQLFPQSDVMHLWWISPLCLPFLSQAINHAKKRFGERIETATQIVFSCFIVISVLFAINFIRGPWTEYQLPVLKGTYASAEKVNRVDFYGSILKYAKPRSASFDCGDGLYSVSGTEYLAADEWFVNWGYSTNTVRNMGTYRFICDRPVEYAQSEAARLGMTVINYSEHILTDYPWSLAVLKKG